VSTLERAIEIAARAHAGIGDKAGEPYILHPLRVMLGLTDGESRIVAVLHDVLEDTKVTREHIMAAGFSHQVLDALDAVTRRPGEPYEALIRRAAAHPIASQVKIADLMDNLDPERLGRLPATEGARLRAKYEAALAILRPTTG
jgi:(p)ppGpp synthase/HD superfamily hydrolase